MTAHSVAFRPRGDIDSASPVSRLLTPFEMAKGLMVIDRLIPPWMNPLNPCISINSNPATEFRIMTFCKRP